jgi:hypothetical protein
MAHSRDRPEAGAKERPDVGSASRNAKASKRQDLRSCLQNSKEALESAAHQLDLLASQGDASAAYEFYSQRCKNDFGDLKSSSSTRLGTRSMVFDPRQHIVGSF